MAIIKITEAAILRRGTGTFYKRHFNLGDKSINGLHYGKLYKQKIITDWNTKIDSSFYKENNHVNKGDILLIDVSEKKEELGFYSFYDLDEKAQAGNHTIIIRPKEDVVNKYLFYYLSLNKKLTHSFSTGDKVASISLRDFSNLYVSLPPKKQQQKIIDIIEPKEELFLKYSNCVRIDALQNTKKDMNLLIDIIEPIEKTIANIRIIIQKIETISYFWQTQHKKHKISDVITWKSNGFAYKKKDVHLNGAYKIFTIRNILLPKSHNSTNNQKNNTMEIGDVITGLSGTIGTSSIIDSKDWVNNQRTLALRSKYFLEINSAIQFHKNTLFSISTGAVQRNISHNDILNLKINVDHHKEKISALYLLLKRALILSEQIKNKYIDLLIK